MHTYIYIILFILYIKPISSTLNNSEPNIRQFTPKNSSSTTIYLPNKRNYSNENDYITYENLENSEIENYQISIQMNLVLLILGITIIAIIFISAKLIDNYLHKMYFARNDLGMI